MNNSQENRLRGKIAEDSAQSKTRNPDSELHLDGEEDSLYTDGLEIEDDSETLADTHRERNTG
jgi:hypothetical protein